MGLSVDLELACDNIEMNSKHNVFLTPIDRINIDDKKMSEAAVAICDSVASRPIAAKVKLNESSKSPVQNDEVKVDADDAEPEEGEILNSEEETNDFEYEAISSDEEYTLRQKIEALEARNSELEKIHSISARSQDAYDLGFGATSTIYGSYKHNAPQFVDEKCFKTSTKHRKFKPFLMTHTNPHKVAVRTPSGKRSMDIISSEDECIALSDIGNGALYRENAKFYDRTHHHHSSSSSRRRKHYRDHHDRRYSDDERETASRTHAKRRSYDIVKAKRRRLKPVLTSSDDDCFEVTSREELKVALNINDGLSADSAINRSTLLHKLRAIQNKSTNDSDQEDTAKKKSTTTKKRCRHKTKSHSEAVQIPSGDAVDSDEQAINEAIIDAIFVDATNRDIHGPTEDDDGVDEAVSLEEQELRLIALKSAVMKKHEARKKRQLVLSIRAYSPTDSLLTPLDEDGTCAGGGDDGDIDGDDDVETVNQLEVNEDTEDNNNMDISPASSPGSNPACQSMDMDLVSSNDDDSQSPVVFSSLPKDVSLAQPNNDHYVSWVYGIPLVRNQNFNHFLMASGETIYSNENLAPIAHSMDRIQLPFDTNANGSMANRIVSMASEEENSLRARLLADLNCSENNKKTVDVIPPNVTTSDVRVNAVADDTNQDESLEADCLRSLLLSSIKHKKYRSTDTANAIEQNNRNKNVIQSDGDNSMIDLPELTEITSNLKEAVKRFQNKNKPKDHTEPTTVPEPAVIEVTKNLRLDNVPVESSNSNALTPVAKPLQSEIAALLTPKNEQKAVKSTMTIQPSAGIVATVKMQQTIIAQTSPKLNTTKEIGPLSAKSVTPVAKVIKIATSNVNSATVMTDTNKARSSPVFSTKEKYSPASSSSSTTKIETAKKSASVNILPWKPVQKLIISLKADDSSTSDFEDDVDTSSEMDRNNESNALTSSGMSADALRAFDNASPASIAMDSPSMAPCSPIDGENSLTTSTDANEDSLLAKDSEKNSDAFQMKLDEYLRQVRAKTDTTPDELPLNDSIAPEKPKLSVTKPTEKKTIITLKQKTPVAVCHLPISAQLEYRRLINRMKILEKQKEQKSTEFKQQKMQQNLPTVTTSDTPFANIRVTLKNENRFIQTNECKVDRQEEQKSVSSSPPPPSPSNVAKLKDSLKKKVLLKNTLNAAAAASNAANESNAQNSTKNSIESQTPSKNEMPLNGLQVDRKVNEEEIAILRKTEAKVNISSKNLLTELEAMLQLVCETHVETTKQIELEKRLHQLRLQCKAVEDELKHQKKRTSSMLPEILAKQKTVETRKTVSRKMSLYCDRMGRKFFGDGYKYHCDMENQIKDKFKSIQCKTKSLKTMAVSLPEPSWLSSVDKAKLSLNSNNSTKTVAINKAGAYGASIGIENPAIATSSIISTPSKSSAVTVATIAEDNLLICVKNSSLIEDDSIPDRVVQQLPGAEDEPSSALTINGNIVTHNKEDDTSGGKKYRSPLDHMQNNIGSSAGQSLTDRNAIVCPFDLMGTCDDEKCLYRHLSS